MPFGNIWTCNNCGHTIRTSALWEFYVDEFGLRQKYGHLGRSTEAQRAGVMGFTAEWYCPVCRSIRDVVVIKFNESKNGPVAALMAYYDKPDVQHQEFDPVCDKCNTRLIDSLENEPCPRCNVGHFQEQARYMS